VNKTWKEWRRDRAFVKDFDTKMKEFDDEQRAKPYTAPGAG